MSKQTFAAMLLTGLLIGTGVSVANRFGWSNAVGVGIGAPCLLLTLAELFDLLWKRTINKASSIPSSDVIFLKGVLGLVLGAQCVVFPFIIIHAVTVFAVAVLSEDLIQTFRKETTS